MFKPVESPCLVPYDGSFVLKDAPCKPPKKAPGKKGCKKRLEDLVEQLHDLQRIFYAYDQRSLLLVFQAMDAAGKDSTIRAVMSGVNPAGCQVFSFKKPTVKELDHDYLWRTAWRLPEHGRIGVFNRSYYEEVLVVRVHPEILHFQKLPRPVDLNTIWQERFESIREHERHLARNGTIVLKFWLNVSKDEQCRRFLSRIEEPRKNWKFSSADVEERSYWDQYMAAYEDALNATSRPYAPWYAIPADDKPYMRMVVAETIVKTLESLNLSYPKLGEKEQATFKKMRQKLKAELGKD